MIKNFVITLFWAFFGAPVFKAKAGDIPVFTRSVSGEVVSLEIASPAGTITLLETAGPQEVTYQQTEGVPNDVAFMVVQKGEKLTVTVRRMHRDAEVRGDLTISLNKVSKASVELGEGVTTSSMPVETLDVKQGAGQMVLSKVSKTLKVDMGAGTVDIKDLAGDLQLNLGVGSGSCRCVETKTKPTLSVQAGSGTFKVFLPATATVSWNELFHLKTKSDFPNTSGGTYTLQQEMGAGALEILKA